MIYLKYLLCLFYFITTSNTQPNAMTALCPPPDSGDQECLTTPSLTGTSIISCGNPSQCCECKGIRCHDCKEVNCGNTYSCTNVMMRIDGNDNSGTNIICTQISSCENAVIRGWNIVKIICDSFRSCSHTQQTINKHTNINNNNLQGLSINCDNEASCFDSNIDANNVVLISCKGEQSCSSNILTLSGSTKGLVIDCNGNDSCNNNNIKFDNLIQLYCNGHRSCMKSTINGICIQHGCNIDCLSIHSCSNSIINIENVNIINCVDNAACMKNIMNIKCTVFGCPVICEDDNSCQFINLDVVNSKGFVCDGRHACMGSVFNIVNNIGGSLICAGHGACKNMRMSNVDNINNIQCIDNDACLNATIIGTCNEGLGCGIECDLTNSCAKTNMQITNVNGLSCTGSNACRDSNIDITLNTNKFEFNIFGIFALDKSIINLVIDDGTITEISGIQCGSLGSCQNSEIIIDASIVQDRVVLNSVQCSQVDSCRNAIFIFINVIMQETNFECESQACIGIQQICRDRTGRPLPITQCLI